MYAIPTGVEPIFVGAATSCTSLSTSWNPQIKTEVTTGSFPLSDEILTALRCKHDLLPHVYHQQIPWITKSLQKGICQLEDVAGTQVRLDK